MITPTSPQALLRKKKLKVTTARLGVLAQLFIKEEMTPQQIREGFGSSPTSLVTVYRTLDTLFMKGIIKARFEKKRSLYRLAVKPK